MRYACYQTLPWMSLNTWEIKIQALFEHKSQIGEPEKLAERMRSGVLLIAHLKIHAMKRNFVA